MLYLAKLVQIITNTRVIYVFIFLKGMHHLAGQKTDKAAGNRVKKFINQHKMHHEKSVILDVGAKMKKTGKWLDHRWRKTYESD